MYTDISEGKRQAVNELLANIGQDAVEDLENLPPAALTALATLERIAEEFQEKGHWFNSDKAFPLTPDTDGEILLSDNIINIKGSSGRYMRREGKLFDLSRQSFYFDESVNCDVVTRLAWDDLPPEARRLIIALSVEEFVENFPASSATATARARALLRAKVAFTKAQIEAMGCNLLNNSYISQQIRR